MVAGLTALPISLQTLLNPAQVESQRLEFKAAWNDKIKQAVVETVCAFANDLYNQNGGYIVLGIEQSAEGQTVLPPRGVDDLNLDRVKKEIFGACKAIKPDYQPMLFIETFQERRLLILSCPGGDNRPYQAPNHRRSGELSYFVRQDSNSVVAKDDTLRQLMEQASKIPWDDRRCVGASTLEISPTLVRRHLHVIGSHLDEETLPPEELYRKLRLVAPVNAHAEPRNVALLFFHDEPTRFFSGARIELCDFPDGRGGDRLLEYTFRGPLPDQLRACQTHLDGVFGAMTQKLEAGLEARRTLPYPERAIREVLVNAVYHRGYESSEPTKVYIEPDCITITSYPGPHPAIRPENFRPGNKVPDVPARNRRIGELLKELKLAESRGSGILKIQAALAKNGSPPAEVECDTTFFSVRIPIHADFAITNAALLRKSGHEVAALETIRRAFTRQPNLSQLASNGIYYCVLSKDESAARVFLETYISESNNKIYPLPILMFVNYLIKNNTTINIEPYLEATKSSRRKNEIISLLQKINNYGENDEDFILKPFVAYGYWCAGEPEEAAILSEEILDTYQYKNWASYCAIVMLIGIRIDIAERSAPEISEQLLSETEDLLAKLTSDDSDGRLYLRLAQVKALLKRPAREVTAAVRQARQRLAGDKEALDYLERLFPSGKVGSRLRR